MLIPTTASAASKHATILFPPGVCHRTPHDQSLKNCFRCAFGRILELWFSKLMRACSISRALGAFASSVYASDGSRQKDGLNILSSPHVIPPTYRFRLNDHTTPTSPDIVYLYPCQCRTEAGINSFTCQFDSYKPPDLLDAQSPHMLGPRSITEEVHLSSFTSTFYRSWSSLVVLGWSRARFSKPWDSASSNNCEVHRTSLIFVLMYVT